MRTLAGLAGLVVLSLGCASGGVPVNPDTPPAATPAVGAVAIEGGTNPGGFAAIRTGRAEVTERIAAPTPALWRALLKTYSGLGVPITGVDSAALTVQATSDQLRRVGGRPADNLFDCAGAYENPAASGRVAAQITTRLVPYTDGGVEVRTLVTARVSRTVGGPVDCPSTGRLEQMISAGIHRELGDSIRH